MKSRIMKYHPYSAFDNYQTHEHVTGWQPSDTGADEDIFKQLKLNLNRYERKYNQSKEKQPRVSNSEPISTERKIEDKENLLKLPAINSVPLKHAYSNKEPFAIKNRNILDDAMKYSERNKPKHQKVSRLVKIRKMKCSQPLKSIGSDFKLNFQKNIPKQQPPISERTSRQQLLSRRFNQLIEYDFSDSKFLPQCSRLLCKGREDE